MRRDVENLGIAWRFSPKLQERIHSYLVLIERHSAAHGGHFRVIALGFVGNLRQTSLQERQRFPAVAGLYQIDSVLD